MPPAPTLLRPSWRRVYDRPRPLTGPSANAHDRHVRNQAREFRSFKQKSGCLQLSASNRTSQTPAQIALRQSHRDTKPYGSSCTRQNSTTLYSLLSSSRSTAARSLASRSLWRMPHYASAAVGSHSKPDVTETQMITFN